MRNVTWPDNLYQENAMTALVGTQPAGLAYVQGYPALNERTLGALKHVWSLSQIQDDWTKGGEVHDAWDRWSFWPYMAKFTYDLTYAVRLLRKIAEEVPAWRDTISATSAVFSEHMCEYASVYDWVEQKGLDPNRASYPYFYYKHLMPPGMAGVYNAPGYAGNGLPVSAPGLFESIGLYPVKPNPRHPYTYPHSPATGRTYDPDPVRAHGSSNMMYKGYFLEQLGHQKAISGDPRWDEPLHIVYDDELNWDYSAEQIASVLDSQHTSALDPGGSSMKYGIDCEVGKVFPLCVAVGGLGLRLHDRLNGTRHSRSYERWLKFGIKSFLVGDEDEDGYFGWFCHYYDRDLNYNHNGPNSQIAAFHMTMACQTVPYNRPWAERLYESAIRYFGIEDDDTLRIVLSPHIMGDVIHDDMWGSAAGVACAQALGDHERVRKMQNWTNQAWEPIMKDGEFYYGFNLDEPWPRGIFNHWAALANVGDTSSFARMYDTPNLLKFSQPTLCHVDFPAVTVRQAIYDDKADVLVISILPGTDRAVLGAPTCFRICNLKGNERRVVEDGTASTNWKAVGDGEIEVTTTVGHHSFLIS
ncbi:linalool dehydratase/isomerase domain-containing protein [Mycobacterium paraintracellulare]|uniref:linalool dehydratase/isomerase domain-containing protein n=1 Tax=Mycobacterium paraintracellulare TaxID=1138383 RepID=UPI001916C8D2|nr:hypothetical protein [Mycobacterium paraintracellulare]